MKGHDDEQMQDGARNGPAWIDGLVEYHHRQQRMARAVEALVQRTRQDAKLLTAARRQRSELVAELKRLRKMIEELTRTMQLLEDASNQQKVLAEAHYERHVIEPMVAHLLPVLNLAQEGLDDSDAGGGERRWLQAVRDALEQFLVGYGVELFQSPVGTRPDLKLARPVQTETTQEPQQDGCVARSLRVGARRGDRVLCVEKVALFRYEAAPEPDGRCDGEPEAAPAETD